MTYSLCVVTYACIKRNMLKIITFTNQFLYPNLSYFSVNVINWSHLLSTFLIDIDTFTLNIDSHWLIDIDVFTPNIHSLTLTNSLSTLTFNIETCALNIDLHSHSHWESMWSIEFESQWMINWIWVSIWSIEFECQYDQLNLSVNMIHWIWVSIW